MKYFRNTELAKIYNVSEKTVRNWIQATQDGKLDLQLYELDGKFWIANTMKNIARIEHQVNKGKKYRNSRGFKTLSPTSEFYDTYSKSQIRDIISNLTVRKEIPLQYGYLDGGANSWAKYAERLLREEAPNILTTTAGLIDINAGYVNSLLGKDKVNVVDLGPGNGLPIRSTLERLIKEDRLNRYIAIDISRDMLTILENNVRSWFGDQINVETHLRNFAEERFDDLFIGDPIDENGNTPANLVFLLGGTLSNFRHPDHVLRMINTSLGRNDLFFYSGYLDTPYTQRYFDLSGASNDQKDPQQSGLIPSFLGMDESVCVIEQLYNRNEKCRFKMLTPKIDLLVKIDLEGKTWPIELRKNEPILLWRHKHYRTTEIIELLNRNEFDLLQATKSGDQNYVLIISKIKTAYSNV